MSGGRRRVVRSLAHAVAVVTILLCLLLARSRYDWVADVAPDIDPRSLHDDGDRNVTVGLMAALALMMEAAALITARLRAERWISGVLLVGLVAAIGWRVLV